MCYLKIATQSLYLAKLIDDRYRKETFSDYWCRTVVNKNWYILIVKCKICNIKLFVCLYLQSTPFQFLLMQL